jgi:hypothetical protein
MRVKRWRWMALATVAAAVAIGAAAVAIGVWQASPRPTQFALRMTPVTPLTTTACVSEARRYGYSASAGAIICTPGEGKSWYRAVLTNRGSYGLPACTTTGFDSHGKPVFAGPLFFVIGGIRGLFVPGHRSIRFYWYLPHKARANVARYAATCSPAPGPLNA